jgi:hypothetical protein
MGVLSNIKVSRGSVVLASLIMMILKLIKENFLPLILIIIKWRY